MKKIKIMLGNFTFIENKCLIHSVDKIEYASDINKAYEIGENNVNNYGAYLIPSEYKGEVVYDN